MLSLSSLQCLLEFFVCFTFRVRVMFWPIFVFAGFTPLPVRLLPEFLELFCPPFLRLDAYF
jgi:hypothetical protein